MKQCLVVDDSRVIRTVAKKIMQEFDFLVEEAENGQEALDACKSKMPDLILLDWNMPVMTGIEFIKHLRALDDGGQPTVIFCTTENDIENISSALSAGANEYIMKPFDSDIIQAKLSQTGMI